MGLLWRLAAAAFFHVLLFVGIAELVDPPLLPWATDTGTQFLTLLAVGVAHSLGMAVLVRASSRRGVGLLLALAPLYVAIAVVFPPIQAELFDLPLPDGAKTDYAILGMIQAVVWVPVAAWLMARWAGEAHENARAGRARLAWARPLLFGLVYVALRYVAERALQLELPEAARTLHLITGATSGWVWWFLRGLTVSGLAYVWLRGARGAWLWRGLWLGLGLAAFDVAPIAPADWPSLALPAAVSAVFGLVLALGWRVAHSSDDVLEAAPHEPADSP